MKILIVTILAVFFLFNTTPVFAGDIPHLNPCTPGTDVCLDSKDSCLPTLIKNGELFLDENNNPVYICRIPTVADTFGKIQPPAPLAGFLAKDPTGAGALSQFFSNFVALIFSVAGIVLILMILWGAFDWMISEGDKEKVAAARNKIINAVIGIILFSIAFAIIQVLGTFTGFKFFAGQGTQVQKDSQKKPYLITCPNGAQINVIEDFKDPYDECRRRGQI